jgi:hypothetical protein
MQDVRDIIEALGGDTHVAREIGSPLTTVNSWKRANYVPAWRVPSLLGLALKANVPLSTADFPEKHAA